MRASEGRSLAETFKELLDLFIEYGPKVMEIILSLIEMFSVENPTDNGDE